MEAVNLQFFYKVVSNFRICQLQMNPTWHLTAVIRINEFKRVQVSSLLLSTSNSKKRFEPSFSRSYTWPIRPQGHSAWESKGFSDFRKHCFHDLIKMQNTELELATLLERVNIKNFKLNFKNLILIYLLVIVLFKVEYCCGSWCLTHKKRCKIQIHMVQWLF